MDDSFAGAAALDVLADETRLDILRALAEQQASDPGDRGLRFADLRKAAGVRDSGNFSYHLQKLTGWLVQEEDDRYLLSAQGTHVMSTLAAGAYDDEAFGPAELDHDCPVCGGPLTASHEDGTFVVECEEGHAVADFLPVSVLEDRAIDDVLELLARHARRYIENVLAGFCALCDGPVERTSYDLSGEDSGAFHYVCERCGTPFAIPPAGVAVVHPATAWFAFERGVDIRADPWTILDLVMDPDHEQVSDDPPRYEVELEVGGDTLRLTVDDEPAVVDVSPSPSGEAAPL